ncbi:MAG TPA: cation transporter dimerization domain-containing protein, partial [Bacteroidales bacterium]|nr:cation transporter dimerization domain-containing protein [Bacteroidales bacterium]
GVRYHEMKSRKSGHKRFVEFHIEMPSDQKLQDVHDFCDNIEKELQQNLKNLDVQIHAEPINYHSSSAHNLQ